MQKITNLSSILLVLFLLLVFCIDTSFAGDTLQGTTCSSTGSFARNSSYEANLNVLRSSLAAKASAKQSMTGFFNTSVDGHDENGRPYTIFGLYMCRGDDVKLDCQTCVPAATRSILQECSNRPLVATVWYVDCLVRYSNESMFGKVDYSQPLSKHSNDNMTTNVEEFSSVVGTLMNNLALEVANSTERYATKEAKITSWITVYSEAQCTPDLSINDCYRCLTAANNIFPDCCTSSKNAQVLMASCYARYDIKPFYARAPSPLSLPRSVPPPTVSLPHSAPLPQIPSNLAPSTGKSKKRTSTITIALVALVAVLVIQAIILCIYLVRRRGRKRSLEDAELFHQNPNQVTHPPSFHHNDSDFPNVESLQYDLTILQIATNNFSDDNKLGEGGFGGVYKGILPNGQEIAVKRLSVCSNQGAEQFKNEVVFIANLQHRNLVRLLGFCLAEYEKLLVYEFVPNRSLDFILFDPRRGGELGWPTRRKIISGIARGMLYLHEDSRLRIVHRDLKASNILLDSDMNPKISDFGTARLFNVDESQANTSRIAGTFGYMAPEYLLHGEFSLKSDVYSFGVLVLEIISGRKSTSFRQSRIGEHLLAYAWKHWEEGNPFEIVDPTLRDSYPQNEVKRCIQLGLLCVQGDSQERPTMSTIVTSLNSNGDLSLPQQPGLCISSKIESNVEVKDLIENDDSTSRLMRLSFSSETSAS